MTIMMLAIRWSRTGATVPSPDAERPWGLQTWVVTKTGDRQQLQQLHAGLVPTCTIFESEGYRRLALLGVHNLIDRGGGTRRPC